MLSRSLLTVVVFLLLTSSVFSQDFTPHGTQPGLSHDLISPRNCRSCHRLGSESFSPYNSWSTSMMALAGRDPLFWASLDVANNDLPGSGDFCLRCHAPAAWLNGRVHKTASGATVTTGARVNGTDGCLLQGHIDQGNTTDFDFEGVDCLTCHRMEPNGPNGENFIHQNASFWIDDEVCTNGTPLGEPCRKGPYKQTTADGLHDWKYSQLHSRSDFCGSCHNVTSPALTLIDSSGTDTSIPFPIERTYREWTLSQYGDAVFKDSSEQNEPGVTGQSCQSCHMPKSPDPNAYACIYDNIGVRAGELPTHELIGGNSFILNLLNNEYGLQLGRQTAFTDTINKTLNLLQTKSATISINANNTGTEINAQITVTNLSGHKLPTGYPEGRRMWLHVRLLDSSMNPIWESGAWDSSTGVLSESNQLKVYEATPGIYNRNGDNQCDADDGNGNKLFHFVLNNCWIKDNRIPPLGFVGGNDPQTRPVNYSYPETSPGSGVLVNYDQTNYNIPIPSGSGGPYTLEAQLQYQTTSKDYVDFLKSQAVDNQFADDCHVRTQASAAGVDYNQSRGEIMHDLWSAYGRSAPVNLASDSLDGL